MGRIGLPEATKEKIRNLYSISGNQKAVARELGLTKLRVERVLFPDRLKARDRNHRKPCARIVRLDREEVPEEYFNVYDAKEDWLTG